MEEQIMKEYSKWKSGKRFLTAAITLSLLGSLGLYSPAAYAEEDFEEYTGSITGKEDNASEYVMAHITKDGGKNYKFTDDSLIKTNQGVKVGDLDYPVNIDASGHVLKFYGHVNDKHTLVHAVEANSKKGVTITAKKLIIDAGNTKSRAEGISVGGQGGTNKDAPYRLTINGDTDIRAHGDTYGLGMYLCGNAEVTVNGNVTMNTHDEKNPWAVYVEKDGGLSYYGGSAIYAGNNYKLQLGPKLTINGLVDLKVNANGAFANGGHSDIYLRGGNIEINKDNTKGYYALLAECATTTMNMERDENKVPVRAGSAKVTIKGNIGASAGAINVNEPETYSRTNLGLATPDSSWTGIAYNAFKDEGNEVSGTLYGSDEIIKKTFFGEINLWLQNGASWTNEAWGEPPDAYYGEDFSESHLKRLVGGESADKAGHIFQKPGEDEDSEGINIRVDDYKGFTNVYYGHKDEKPTDILGGTFTVTKAQPGSGITLITDSKGLNVDSSKAANKNLVSETLNALANKLFYTAYKNGETNLAGKVEIAEGLTSSSLSKRMEDVTFKESNGQGQYLYTPASDIPEEQTETAFTDTITGVKAKDMKYVNTGVRKEDGTYKFTKDSEITVAAGGPAVKVEEDVIIRADGKTLKMKTVEGSGTVYGINQSTAKKAEITAKNLDVEVTSTSRAEGIHMANSNAAIRPEMTINGNVNLKVSGTANTLGAYIQGNSRLTVNGNVTADVDGHNGGFSYYGATGLYSTSNMGPNSMGADITVNGNVDLKGKAHGIFANAGGSKVTVNGGGSIEVDKASTNPYAAIRAEDGIVNMNVKLDSNGNAVGSLDKKVNIKGNLAVTTGAVNEVDKKGTLSQINLGLTTSDSTLQGVVYNAFPDEGKKAGELTFKGEANLFLANGAAWTNEKYIDTGTSWGGKNFEGSHLTRLAGGASADKAGQIFQKDTGNITVDNYSGYTDVYYAHEETAPKTMIGGDFIIRKAASGSGISLITDNKGLNTSSDKAADKNLVSETLNALANKLFYKAYADGEKNLTGFVKIAEGLTSSEAVLKTGNITFKKDNGQGRYLYTPATDEIVGPITGPEKETADRNAKGVSPNAKQGKVVSGMYNKSTPTTKNNPMIVDMNGFNLSIAAESGNEIADAVYVGNNDYITVKNDAGKKISITSTNTDTRAANGIFLEGNSHLNITGPVEITKVHTKGGSATGIAFQGSGSEAVIDGSLTISNVDGDKAEKQGRYIGVSGIRMTGDNTSMTVTGPVNISDFKGSALHTAGADSVISVGGGTISTAADADKSHNFYAARVEKGTVNINMRNGAPGSARTNIIGDMYVTGQYGKKVIEYSGGQLADWQHRGNLHVALTDKDSSWTGVAAYEQYNDNYGSGGNTMHDIGNFDLYLQNGATWTNEQQSHVTTTTLVGKNPVYNGSYLMKLHGGSDAVHKGYIYQKDSKPITVDNYSGHTLVFYDHTGDGSAAENYSAGDFRIKTAEEGSSITMRTGAGGINTADKTAAGKALNSLANKLYYMSYAQGDTKLKGTVEIAEGLTSSSVSASGDITFKTDTAADKNGQGTYIYSPPEPLDGPIVKDRLLKGETTVTADDTHAEDGYVSAAYNGDDSITVDMANHGLRLEAASSASTKAAAVRVGKGTDDNKKSISFINMEKNKPLVISSDQTNGGEATGIYVSENGKLSVAGDVVIDKVSTSGRKAYGVANRGPNAELVIKGGLKIAGAGADEWRAVKAAKDTTGISVTAIANIGNNAKLTIEGPLDVKIQGTAINSTAKGGVMRLGSGRILTPMDEHAQGNSKLVKGVNGTVFINMNEDGTAAKAEDTVLQGNIYTERRSGSKAVVNVGLASKNSSWTGVTDYNRSFSSDAGEVNLYLSHDAVWNNKKTASVTGSYMGSHIDYFKGGSDAAHAGIIRQNDDRDINIDHYSGHAILVYDHKAEKPKEMIGGRTLIKKAEPGSVVRMVTGNGGLNTNSNKAADKNLVSETLNALANKLYYTGYNNAAIKDNLKGTVEIAEGLTASSASVAIVSGNMSFQDVTGRGEYKFTPAEDDPHGQTTSDFGTPITGEADKDQEYVKANVLKDDVYTFTNAVNTVTVDDGDTTTEDLGYHKAVAAVVGINKDITIHAADKSLKLNAENKTERNSAVGMYTKKKIDAVAKDISIDTKSSVGDVYGIYIHEGGKADIAGNVSILAKQGGDGFANGIKLYNGGSALTINGNLAMKGTGSGNDAYGVSAAQKGGYGSIKTYLATGINIYDKDGASFTLNGNVDMAVKGVGVDMRGSEKNTVTIAGGTILTPDDREEASYIAVAATSGTFTMGMNDAKTGSNGKDVIVQGTISLGAGGTVNLGLGSSKSRWTGVSDNEDERPVNLYLSDGGIWENRQTAKDQYGLFAGSRVTKVAGGTTPAKAGVIAQKDSNPITIDHYSGHTILVYDHEASSPATMIGGDTIIANAEAGSGITMRTNSRGLDTNSGKAKDKNLVNATLNALANKLFYTAYKNGETNLTGKVEIAEGLTTSAVAKKTGNISFKNGTGQGEYIYTPEEDPSGDIIDANGPITFDYKKDSKVFGRSVSQIGGNSKDLIYNFADKTVNITAGSNDWAPMGMTPNVKAVINAKQLNLKTPNVGMMGTYGIYLEDGDDITVNSDVNMTVNGGAYMVDGIFMGHMGAAEAAKTKLTINGNVTMRGTGNDQSSDDFWGIKGTGEDGGYPTYMGSRWAPEGIYLGKEGGSSITINGNVDMAVKGNGAVTDAYYKVAGQNSLDNVLTLNGDVNIITPKSRERGFLALGAFGGTVNVNVKTETDAGGKVKVTGASDHKVNLVGNLYASKDDGNGDNTYYFRDGAINLGLTTSDSTWSGVVSNTNKNTPTGKSQQGDINLWLQNGATWNHEAVSRADAVYAAGNNGKTTLPSPSNGLYGAYDGISHLTTLTGGKDADHAGLIAMKDKADVEVGTYSGFSRIYYNHENSTPKQMIGGDFKVSKALDGSRITLMTGSNGLDTSSTKAADKNLVSETLNALAGKLYYLAKDGKLSAKAALAEGLTASEASLDLKNVTFKESNGQGQYLYTPASDIPEEQTETAFTDTITGVKAKDMKYVNTGVRKEDGTYKFTKDSEITVAAGGPAVKVEEDVIIRADGKTLKMKTVEGSGTVYGINQSTAKKAEITAKNLDVEVTSTSRAEGIHMANSNAAIRPEMTINGNVNLKVSGTANTLGAYIQGNSKLTVNGNVTADVDGHNGGFSYYGATGLYSTSNMGPNSMGADITVNGNVDLKGKAHGIFANAGGSKVTVNGGGSIEVDKASTNPYAAIRAEDGIVNMNVKLDSNGNAVGSLDKKVNIKGNLAVTTGAVNEVDKKGTLSQINLGLTTSDSTLQGVVYNAFPDEGKKAGELTFKGEANLFLANGAAWMNEKYGDTGTSWGGKNFEGSHLTRLAGGVSADKAGQIFQKDTGNITVDNYSGYTDVYYAHEETAPKTMIGGDFIIRKAASGSGISLITDNKGLNTSSNASADKNLVSETLNALANKLFYKAYADGENNLTGFVKIAEGLTSSEAVLKTGNITFKKDNGQGQYLYETAYPNEQVTDPINKTIDGSTASEQVYKEAGVYKSDTDTYKFTKNPATVNGDSGAAVDAGAKDIHVDSGENTLNLNGGNTGVGVKAEGGKTADIKGNANITGKTGVVADGAGSKVLLSGNSNITAEGDGIVASGSGIVEAAGITNVTAGAGRKAVRAGAGSSVSLQSGKLKGDVEADGGTVFLREAKTEGNAAAAAGGSINLTDGSVSGAATADNGTIETENTNVVNGASALNGGKLKLRNGKISGGVKTDAGSAADVVMDRAGNALKGDVSGEGQTDITLSNGGNWDGNSAGSGKTQVKVGNGSTWTGTSMNSNTDVDLEGKWKQTGNSKVRKLISNNGVLDKTASESGNTDIGKLSGRLSLIYAHDKTNPTKVLGGSTFVATADAGSTVDMITDNAGLDTNSDKAADKNKVSEVLNAMAGKLQYTGYQNGERNLKGKLRIAEGLTSSSAGLKTEALSFKRDGRGYFDYTPAKPNKPEIETGDYETSIMSSTRSALTSSILVWRNDMNDMYKRMGDLRIGAESGLWARAYGGRISYDANNAYMKNSYWAAQVGIDKRLASGWHVGGAFGYNDGSATYRYGGKGDPKLYTLAAYATRVSEDGQYVDVIAKAGKLSNKFTAYNKYSAPALRNYVEGKYDTYGYGISAEYGKKIRMGKGFVTPQAELTWSRLSSDSFDAAAPSGESMRVNQSSVNSLIGRLGVVAGVESDKGNFYAKASLFHEFDGDGHILFSEPGKTGKRSSFSLKDTWAEIALGGNYYLSPRSMIYADFTKSFGGDYKVDWRINAGIRFSF
ncbi:outer membrane autotransporter barrel domain protein [Dialister invisus DSM 15470]|uniref:Outer membrane autotransporter barrel domain protein n=2 Tax=Dialister invisus TaxID=218538 RepID=C9LQG7_9FIRM|nr:outer membrane autotransporter barrel domain protein [Dialister invisus DSM 15470]